MMQMGNYTDGSRDQTNNKLIVIYPDALLFQV